MTRFVEWLNNKFKAWEEFQEKPQSFYTFSRYLDVTHSRLAQWIAGSSLPGEEDLPKLADRLGMELYDVLSIPRPESPLLQMNAAYLRLPEALRKRLCNAIIEADEAVTKRNLDPESIEAKQRVMRTFERWGFKIIP